jgi:hypothetical protein
LLVSPPVQTIKSPRHGFTPRLPTARTSPTTPSRARSCSSNSGPPCPYCVGETSIVDQVSKEFADKGLLVLAIDVGESKKKVKQYIEAQPRKCRIVYMEDTNLAAMYAATVYPIYVVIDREGNIVGTQRGAGGEPALRRLLARAGIGAEEDAALR